MKDLKDFNLVYVKKEKEDEEVFVKRISTLDYVVFNPATQERAPITRYKLWKHYRPKKKTNEKKVA